MVRKAGVASAEAGRVRGALRAAMEAVRPMLAGSGRPVAHRRASRRALKNWRVRSRLLLLVIIPTATAVAAGGVFIASSVQNTVAYRRVQTLATLSGKVTGLVQSLQNEREDLVRFIDLGSSDGGRGASPSSAIPPGPELRLLNQDYRVTDGWARQVKALAGGIGGSYPALARQDAGAAITAIGNLPAIRVTATGTRLPALIVIEQYATVISTLLAVETQIAAGGGDSTLAGSVRVLDLVSSMKEDASRQQALLSSALRPDLVSLGQFGMAQQSAITDAQAQQQGSLNEFGTAATAAQRQMFDNVLSSPNVVQAQAQEQQAISLASSGSSIGTDPTIADASSSLSYVVSGMRSAEQRFANSVISRSGSLYDGAIVSAVTFTLAVVALLAIAMAATLFIGRSMVRPLRRLRHGAFEIAGDRLPEMVRRMSETGGEGARVEVEPIDVDSLDEIGEVARAFDQVHREAVRLAGNEAMLRGNMSAMFTSLSRRSVPLIERLTRMIDSLEHAEDDPGRLSDLFSMDHLVTRMRRNSENLLVLAGEEPVRKWSEPVSLADVVRAATSEIEQYSRVTLDIQPDIVVSGQAAADVVHMLAEIIENATIFSPKDTPVCISGKEVASGTRGGVLLEVRDTGIGIPPSRLSEINRRLDDPPLIDVSVSRHMGLFVVSRLAARHGARIQLRAAAPQGLSALVWLPDGITGRNPAQPVRQLSWRLAESVSPARPRAGGRRTSGEHVILASHATDGGPQGAEPGRRSTWFRAKRPSVRSALDGTTRSENDVARSEPVGPSARGPVLGDRTSAGLPSRIPGANMISGSAAGRTADRPAAEMLPAPPASPPRRSPELARNRLSGFQLGSRDAETGTPSAGEGTGH